MQFKMKGEIYNWVFLFGIIVLLLEIAFFNSGVIFSLLVAIGMIYFGRKKIEKYSGKLLFWSGVFFLAISIFNMMTFKFLLLAIIVHFIIQYYQTKKDPTVIRPVVNLEKKEPVELIKKKPVFEQTLFGDRKTPEHVYEWNDINIQTAIGDTTIDLSYTVLPKGETVIFIRNFIGNLQILVPYDIEISVNHSSIAGTSTILQHKEEKIFNQSLQYQTAAYDQAEQKIKIFTSLVVGDIEVKRV